MSLLKKTVFILLLVVFVGTSVFLSFNTVVRPTYEFEELTDIGGTDVDGWAFIGFNGNQNTQVVNIDFVRDKDGNNPDETKPIVAVDEYTFVSDENVKYIYISDTVQYIDERAFVYCKQLRGVYVDDNNPWYTDVDGVLYTKDMKKIILYPISYCTEIVYKDIEKYGEVKNIGLDIKETLSAGGENPDALYLDFKNQASDDISRELFDEMLEKGVMAPYIGTYYIVKDKTDTTVTVEKAWSCDEVYSIPEGIERIGKNCFYKCDRLQRIDIPSTVKEIGDMAFFKCFGISLVNLPDGLEKIGCDAFSYCENMKYSIFIPESVEEIGHHCFYQCDRLEKFFLEDTNEETITLGGSWQPKGENDFKPEPPVFGASYADFEAYNNERLASEEPAPVAVSTETDAPAEEKPQNFIDKIKAWIDSFNVDGTNYLIIIILIIVVFIPGMTSVVLEVIRKMFKEDFLMSKKKKAKVKAKLEENERLRHEYLEKLEKEKNENEGGEN